MSSAVAQELVADISAFADAALAISNKWQRKDADLVNQFTADDLKLIQDAFTKMDEACETIDFCESAFLDALQEVLDKHEA